MSNETCGECRWCVPFTSTDRCTRFPPQFFITVRSGCVMMYGFSYPDLKDTKYVPCGEFAPKPKEGDGEPKC